MPIMEQLFTLNDTVKRDPRIDDWFEAHPEVLRAIARDWFIVMRESGEDVRETLHDGFPTACIGEFAFAHVATYSAHVNVAFFRGADLDDPHGLLEGSGKYMRHVKLRPGSDVDPAALLALVEAAYTDMKSLLEAG